MTPVADLSPSAVPDEALEQFEGQWIAIRNGEVVAHAETVDDLAANPTVETTDMYLYVPQQDSAFF